MFLITVMLAAVPGCGETIGTESTAVVTETQKPAPTKKETQKIAAASKKEETSKVGATPTPTPAKKGASKAGATPTPTPAKKGTSKAGSTPTPTPVKKETPATAPVPETTPKAAVAPAPTEEPARAETPAPAPETEQTETPEEPAPTAAPKPSAPVTTEEPAPPAHTTKPAAPAAAPVLAHVHTWVTNTETVHHDEVGHYEDVVVGTRTVVDEEEYDEPVVKTEAVCSCGEILRTDYDFALHLGFYPHSYGVEDVIVDYIHHDAVTHEENITETQWIVDSPAWDETISTTVCSGCGATR